MRPFSMLCVVFLVSGVASAEEIKGSVRVERVETPTPDAPHAAVDHAYLSNGKDQFRITAPKWVELLDWFTGKTVVVEGIVASAPCALNTWDLQVTELVQPVYQNNVEGTVFKTKAGWTGLVRVVVDGKELSVTGPNYRTLRKASGDLKRRDVVFNGYLFANTAVVVELAATARTELFMTQGVILGEIQTVPAGETVWILSRGFMGATSEIATSSGVVGRVLSDNLKVGAVVSTESPHPARARRGVIGALGD
jgi:hypothetical protein